MEMSLQSEPRDCLTHSQMKQLRSSGRIPGTVYGQKVGSVSIAVSARELLMLLKSNPHGIIEMDIPNNGKQPVMIQEVQRDPISRELIHTDFYQINMDQPIRTSVSIDFIGEPSGVDAGGILQILMHELEIRCLPADIPASITVDISALELGDTVTVRNLSIPEAVEVKSMAEDIVVTVLTPQRQAEEPASEQVEEEPREESQTPNKEPVS